MPGPRSATAISTAVASAAAVTYAQGVAHDDSEKPFAVFGAGVPFGQCLDIATDGGQRRPQFMRHVGDEITSDLIGAFEVGNVVQHEHGAVRAAWGRRSGARHQCPRLVARRRQLHEVAGLSGQGGADQVGNGGVTDDLDIVTADRQIVEPQQLSCGLIGELHPSTRIEHNHAFQHAGEDGLHARPIARELFEPSPHFLH
jgi:hypothetical protein